MRPQDVQLPADLGERLDARARALLPLGSLLEDARAPDPVEAEALGELTRRLRNTYPYPDPRYAGQMLKPPHAVAWAAYATAMLLNPNNHALDGGPATAELERDAVAQLAAMFGLPEHLGHLTASGTIANLEALWVARELRPDDVIVSGANAHYTHARVSAVLGARHETVAEDALGRLDLDALEARLRAGGVGTVVCTPGTTGLGAVDDIAAIADLCDVFGARLHVDAAYGGFFALLADGGGGDGVGGDGGGDCGGDVGVGGDGVGGDGVGGVGVGGDGVGGDGGGDCGGGDGVGHGGGGDRVGHGGEGGVGGDGVDGGDRGVGGVQRGGVPTVRTDAFAAIARADSVVVDPHKHGLQPYGCGAVLFADPAVGRLYAHDSPYTYFTSDDLHLGEISLECSRAGASAAALWTTLRALPLTRAGLGRHVAAARAAALEVAARLDADERTTLLLDPELDIVCVLPATGSAAERSAAAVRAFDTLAADGWHVAKLRVGTDWLRRRHPDVTGNAETVVALRCCLLKAEHEAVAADLAAALAAHLTAA